MSRITQINLDGVRFPRVSGERYACWEDDLSVLLEMTSGRMVEEVRGKVWRVRYSCDVLDEATHQLAMATLRSRGPLPATVLPDTGGAPITSTFFVDSLTPAAFAFEENGKAVWRGLGFTLREVRPHDR